MIFHRPQPVAWGKRRGDYQVGSLEDQRTTYRRARLSRALATAPVVLRLDPRACVGEVRQAAPFALPTQEVMDEFNAGSGE